MSTLWVALFVVLAASVVFVGFVVIGLLRRVVPLIEDARTVLDDASFRAHVLGVPAGAVVPAFMAARASGGMFTDAELRGSGSVILFLDSGCAFCGPLFQDLETGFAPSLGRRLVVVTSSEDDARRLAARDSEGVTILVQRSRAIARLFETARTPHAFVLDPNLKVLSSGSPSGWRDLQEIVAAAGTELNPEGGDLIRRDVAAAL